MVDVHEITGKNAVTYEQGGQLLAEIENQLSHAKRVTLDFTRVEVIVSSFFNASIAPLLATRNISELQARLEFVGLRDHDRQILNVVIHNAIQFYSNRHI